MRIENFRTEGTSGLARIVADVVWEDCDRPRRCVYFETVAEHAGYLARSVHPFFVACCIPALYCGEKRLWTADEVCPELQDGLRTAVNLFTVWHGLRQPALRLECRTESEPQLQGSPRAACFLSGGVDSLFTLRKNRREVAASHPASIQDAILVYGFDMGYSEGLEHISSFDLARQALQDVARDASVQIVPVYTNIRHLCEDGGFWIYWYFGAALASVGHALAGRISRVSIASSSIFDRAEDMALAHGSHPALDPLYSSYNLRVLHDGARFSRLDKVRAIADWGVAMKGLRVCTRNLEGVLNCGRCEKCVRTLLELLAVGASGYESAFAETEVTDRSMAVVRVDNHYLASFYRDMIAPLEARGMKDMALRLQRLLRAYRVRCWIMQHGGEALKQGLKKLDAAWLGGRLRRAMAERRNRA